MPVFVVTAVVGCASSYAEPEAGGYTTTRVPEFGFGWIFEDVDEGAAELYFGDDDQCAFPPGWFSDREFLLEDTHLIVVGRAGEPWLEQRNLLGEFEFLETGALTRFDSDENTEHAVAFELEDKRTWALPMAGRISVAEQSEDAVRVEFLDGPWTGETVFTVCVTE